MNGIEIIDKLCKIISKQSEIIRKQALLLELMQADSEELAAKRTATDIEISEILKES